jgi:hypothetical protein
MTARDEMIETMVKLIAAIANVPENHAELAPAAQRIVEHIEIEAKVIRGIELRKKLSIKS